MFDKDESTKPRVFGFCNICRHEDAVKAVQKLSNMKNLKGESFIPVRAMSRKEQKQNQK